VVVLVLPLAAASEHRTTRFLVVSIYHVELVAVVVAPLLPVAALLPLENSGMYGGWLLEVVLV
jgi:hypothetical protein